MSKIRVFLAEDNDLERTVLRLLLSKTDQFQIVGEVANGVDLLLQLKETFPDIILLDAHMPQFDGPACIRQILTEFPRVKLLFLSAKVEFSFAKKMMELGAHGYISKNSSAAELYDGIVKIQEGENYLSQDLVELGKQIRENRKITLNVQEKQIIMYIKEGLNANQIAQQMDIPLPLFDSAKTALFKKLNLRKTADLISYAANNALHLDTDGTMTKRNI